MGSLPAVAELGLLEQLIHHAGSVSDRPACRQRQVRRVPLNFVGHDPSVVLVNNLQRWVLGTEWTGSAIRFVLHRIAVNTNFAWITASRSDESAV